MTRHSVMHVETQTAMYLQQQQQGGISVGSTEPCVHVRAGVGAWACGRVRSHPSDCSLNGLDCSWMTMKSREKTIAITSCMTEPGSTRPMKPTSTRRRAISASSQKKKVGFTSLCRKASALESGVGGPSMIARFARQSRTAVKASTPIG